MPGSISSITQPPMLVIPDAFVTSTVSIGTSNKPQAPAKVNRNGFIASLIFDLDLAIIIGTGVVDTVPANAIINSIAVKDANGREIVKCSGSQLPRIIRLATLADSLDYNEYKKGRSFVASNITSTGGTFRVEMPVNIPTEYQQISIEVTFGVLSDILSTVGTATATATLKIHTKNYVGALDANQLQRTKLLRFQTFNLPTTSVELDYKNNLSNASYIESMAVEVTADSDIDNITFKPIEGQGLERVSQETLVAIEDSQLDASHSAGFFILPISPSVVGESTNFKIDPTTSITPVLYLGYRRNDETV